jgi:hypothetical protein
MRHKRASRSLLILAASAALGWPGQILAGPVILGGMT